MSLFARILPALLTTAAAAAVIVGMAHPASPGPVRLASDTVLSHHHWDDDDDYYSDNDRHDHNRYDHNRGDDGVIVLDLL